MHKGSVHYTKLNTSNITFYKVGKMLQWGVAINQLLLSNVLFFLLTIKVNFFNKILNVYRPAWICGTGILKFFIFNMVTKNFGYPVSLTPGRWFQYSRATVIFFSLLLSWLAEWAQWQLLRAMPGWSWLILCSISYTSRAVVLPLFFVNRSVVFTITLFIVICFK